MTSIVTFVRRFLMGAGAGTVSYAAVLPIAADPPTMSDLFCMFGITLFLCVLLSGGRDD